MSVTGVQDVKFPKQSIKILCWKKMQAIIQQAWAGMRVFDSKKFPHELLEPVPPQNKVIARDCLACR